VLKGHDSFSPFGHSARSQFYKLFGQDLLVHEFDIEWPRFEPRLWKRKLSECHSEMYAEKYEQLSFGIPYSSKYQVKQDGGKTPISVCLIQAVH
jgi:hypothetical protein